MRFLSLSVFAILVLHAFGQDVLSPTCPVGTNPCQNGAECVGIEGIFDEYTCRCLYGWAGKNCDVQTYQNCGYNLFETSGSIRSPNYPLGYGFNQNCHYYVRVHGAKQLTFNVEMFDTEFAKDALQYAPGVQWDFAGNYTVLEGNFTTGVPSQFTVQGSDVWFVFESDRNIERSGFVLTYTASNPSNCASNLCQNGAICTDLQNDYDCACVPGYQGRNCEINTDDCVGIVCAGSTVCQDRVNGYVCQCPPGYSGVNCDQTCMNNYCKKHLRPKCGSDGKTYRNRCYLLNAKCMDPGVYMVSKGVCPGKLGPIAIIGGDRPTCIQGGGSSGGDSSIEFIRCPPKVVMPTTKAPIPTKALTPNRCIDDCPLIFEPVCGSDGVTYPNLCKLDVVMCLNDPTLVAIRVGECVVMTTACRGDKACTP